MPQTNAFWRTFRPEEGFYTSELETPSRLPVRTFLPTGYEPQYAYPLLVLFHGHASSEEQILRLAPRLSRRNYIAIALRGPRAVPSPRDGQTRYAWESDGEWETFVEDYVIGAVEQTRRNYHVHSERIYLAGVGEGAATAYRLAMTFPEKVAGIISLNGIMPRENSPLFRFNQMRQLRAFIAHGIANSVVPLSAAKQDYLLLYTAGLAAQMKTYPTNHKLHPHMLRDVNRWIIDAINDETFDPPSDENAE
jgi:phospholipase/carboxylesterase